MAKSGIKNLKAFQKKLNKRMVQNPERELSDLIRRSTSLVEQTVLDSIRSGGSGITYQKYNPRREHTASAQGEPPATDTGFLINSITSIVKKDKGEVVGQVITSAPYAKFLEFGTSNILPRPFMQPALEKNRPKIRRIFKKGGYVD